MKAKIFKTVQEFSNMNSNDIVKLMEKDKSLAIIGDVPGQDRHIVKRLNF